MSRAGKGRRIAVLGSELDGLVAALDLAQRGLEVTLVEKSERVGGIAAPVEIAPGYRAPLALDRGRLRGDVLRRLRIPADHLATAPTSMLLTADGDLVSAREAREAAAWLRQLRALCGWARRITHNPAPPLDPRQDLRRAIAAGFATRMLGKRRLRLLLRVASLPIADWLTESIDDGPVAAALAAPALESSVSGPMAMGSGLHALLRAGAGGARAAQGLPALLDVVGQRLRDHGVDIRRGVPLQGVHSVGEKWILHLESNETIEFDAVVSAVPPTCLLLDLVQGAQVPIEMLDSLSSFRTRGNVGVVLLAIETRPPDHVARPGLLYQVGWHSLAEVERAADEFKHGRMAATPPMELTVPSLDDPSLASEGGSVLVAQVRYCPAEIEHRHLIDAAFAGLRALWPEGTDRVIGSCAWSPADLERDYCLPGGHLEHGEWALDQLLFLRPDVRCRGEVTPLPGLFVCGPGFHPGVGLHGGSGWWAAKQVHDEPWTGRRQRVERRL